MSKKSMPTKWIPLSDVVELLNQFSEVTWCSDFGLKYIELRIDTRDNHCLVMQKDGDRIDLDRLRMAISKTKERYPNISK